ncbi:hypothetical protein niasHT_027135 [Heterodera trifolii]|uniref:Uncharacterized protein n=1 Tax=Heterodera trifolii TaxID=157864 RepID=A0ABD2KAU6_9BILA
MMLFLAFPLLFTLALHCYALNGANLAHGDIEPLLNEVRENSELDNWTLEKGCKTIRLLKKDEIEETTTEMKEFGQIVSQICHKNGMQNGQMILRKLTTLGQQILAQLKMTEKKTQKFAYGQNHQHEEGLPLAKFGTEMMAFAKRMPDEMPEKNAFVEKLKAVETNLSLPSDVFQFLLTELTLLSRTEYAKKDKNAEKDLLLASSFLSAQRRQKRQNRPNLIPPAVIAMFAVIGLMTGSPVIVLIGMYLTILYATIMLHIILKQLRGE